MEEEFRSFSFYERRVSKGIFKREFTGKEETQTAGPAC